ncbi:MAG: hypothetical protein ABIH00_00485 [Armatimonadota bacterium]
MSVFLSIDPAFSGIRKLFVKLSGKEAAVLKSAKPDKIIATIPSNKLTFRKLAIPFRDRKKINEIIKEDLSQTLLFYNDAVWDFTFGPDNEIFVTITSKNTINELIKQMGVKPHIFEAEPYALVRSANSCGHEEGLIIDFGASKTVFAGFKNNLLNFCRVLLKSTNNLINELANKKGLTEAEALKIIREEGLKNKDVLEFFKSLLAIALPSSKNLNYSKILITGKSCRIPYLADFLKEASGLTVEEIKSEKFNNTDNTVAYGASLKNINKEHGVNLAPYKTSEGPDYKKWAVLLLIPLMLLLADVKYKEHIIAGRYNKINNQMVKILKRDFPQLKKASAPLATYKSMIRNYGISGFADGQNALDVLSSISEAVNPGTKIDSLEASEKFLTLTGKSTSVKTAEAFKQSLAQKFKSTEITEVKSGKEGVKFTIKINLGAK